MAGEVRDLRLPVARVDDRPGRQQQDRRLALAVDLVEDAHAVALDEALLVGVAGARLLMGARRRRCRRRRHGRASKTRLNGVSAARRKRVKPPAVTTSRMRASPAWAPERQADLLGERGGGAEERRGRVVDAADGGEVVLDAVAGERLHDQPGAVGVERCEDVPGRAHGVAHVVQAVEGRHEVVAGARVALGRRRLEADASRHAGVARPPARPLDRGAVVVEAHERRGGVRLAP